jgi:hypothetical protein
MIPISFRTNVYLLCTANPTVRPPPTPLDEGKFITRVEVVGPDNLKTALCTVQKICLWYIKIVLTYD